MNRKNLLVVTGILFIMVLTSSVMAYENSDADNLNNNGNPEEIDPEGEAKQEEKSEMFSQFEIEGQKMKGGYVGFEMAPGKMLNYKLNSEGETVFARIQFGLTAWTQTEFQMNGAVFEAEKEGAKIMSHNNPSGMLYIRSNRNITVAIEPGEGVSFEDKGNGSFSVNGLSVQSKVQLQNATSLMNGSTLQVHLRNGSCFMYMIQYEGEENQFQYAYKNAIMEGKVDGEMQICKGSGNESSQHFPFKGEVDMKVSGIEEGKRIRVEVESLEKKGKVVAFKMDGEILSGRSLDRIRVSFDGEEIEPSDDPEEVIGSIEDKPMYCIEMNEDGQYQALFYVPEFSTHEIEFQIMDVEESPGFAITLIVVALAVITTIWVLIIRRNR